MLISRERAQNLRSVSAAAFYLNREALEMLVETVLEHRGGGDWSAVVLVWLRLRRIR